MQIFIRSAQAISPQDTFLAERVPNSLKEYQPYYQCALPDFKDYFNPIERRRMSKLLKMGAACAIEAINEAEIEKPDAIISGTGLGCVEDTEKFLHNILHSEEGLLPPTAFVQSTHNSIGALVALKYKCHEHNMLYVQKTLSFEHALLDSFLLFKENNITNILVGGFDEITKENYELKKGVGIFRDSSIQKSDITASTLHGAIAGEGTAYFVLSSIKSDKNYAELMLTESMHKTATTEQIAGWINDTLKRHNLTFNDVDVFISGINGDARVNKTCKDLAGQYFSESSHAYYKHMCGEYDTASSFGMWFAIKILISGNIPAHALLNKKERDPEHILIYNHGSVKEHSIILLKRV
ncbi:MAG: beta-ketoacyl synthase chain length factor [Bacteroidales bacterium]|nr:beta-ketoacyl synthase chain length factor [Bacteroidales bacterium]